MLVWSRTQPRLENLCEGEDRLNQKLRDTEDQPASQNSLCEPEENVPEPREERPEVNRTSEDTVPTSRR